MNRRPRHRRPPGPNSGFQEWMQYRSEYDNLNQWARSYLSLLDLIPGGLPDGTGILTPEEWVRWARTQLGYPPAPAGDLVPLPPPAGGTEP